MAHAAVIDRADPEAAREWLALGRMDDAQAEIERCLVRGVAPVTARFLYGLCRLRQSEVETALEAFTEVVQVRPRDHMAHFYAGVCLERLGRTNEARECYRNALELDPGQRVSEALPARVVAPHLGLHDAPGLPRDLIAEAWSSAGPRPVDTIPPVVPFLAGRCLFSAHPQLRSYGMHLALTILSAVFAGAAGIAALGSGVLLPWFGLGLAACSVLAMTLALRAAATHVEILERRIDVRSGLLRRRTTSVWVHRIEAIRIKRSPLDVITGRATLHLRAGGPGIPLACPRLVRLRGLGDHRFVLRLCAEMRAAALQERRELRPW